MTRAQSLVARFRQWWLEPATPLPFAILRITLASILLVQSTLIVGEFLELYSPNGLMQGDLRRYFLAPALPFYVDWQSLAGLLATDAETLVKGTFLLYVGSLVFLLMGFHARPAALAAWATHFLLKLNLGYNSSYGVDTFSHIALFYLLFFPLDRALSLDLLLGRVRSDVPTWSRISLRVFQLHLFLVYFSTGIEKILGWQWRSGEVMWRAWNLPQFRVFDMTWMAWHPWLAKALAWSTLFLEIGYPFLLGNKRTRRAGAWAVVGLHAGIAFTMHLWTFSAVMIALTSCAFLVPADPLPKNGKLITLPSWLTFPFLRQTA